MINLRPPDGRVFVTIEKETGKQIDAVITHVGNDTELEVGQRICVPKAKIEKVELQDTEAYSVHESNVFFVYE
jgi:hypothetical protein